MRSVQSNRKLLGMYWVALGFAILFSFTFWYWAVYIREPVARTEDLAKGRPLGNNSDLYPRWLGARELLLRGRDPYSTEITREIQTGFYGRPLNSQKPSDPVDKESFAYPIYVVLFLAPTVNMPFDAVSRIFRWLLLVFASLSVPVWMSALRIRWPWLLTVSAMLLTASSPPAATEFFKQNLAAFVILLLALSAAAAVRNWLALSGFLLALATIKPNTAAPWVFWFALWAISDWKQRRRLLWSFSGTMAALLIAAEVLSPHWIPRFLEGVREYHSYANKPSIIDWLLPRFAATFVEVWLVLSLIVACWRWRKAAAGSQQFGLALAWIGTVTVVLFPQLAVYNEFLLVPPLLVLAAGYSQIQRLRVLARATTKGLFVCLISYWTVATALVAGSFFLPPAWMVAASALPDCPGNAIGPLTVMALILTASPWRASNSRSFVLNSSAPLLS